MPVQKMVRLPNSSNRSIVIGRTGSGKTQFAMWLLSTQNIQNMPWVIIDFKGDKLINSIERAEYITFADPLPTRPGIYILQPLQRQKAELEGWLERVYYHERMGLFIDEVYLMGQYNEEFHTILMQGRSKEIPVIACSQRPTAIAVPVKTEASFWYVFDLTQMKDRATVAREIPLPVGYDVPDYHSYGYDVERKHLFRLGPAPDAESILARIDSKIPERRRTL